MCFTFTFGLLSRSLDRKGNISDGGMQFEVVKFQCTFSFVCSFPIFVLSVLWVLFNFFEICLEFLCFLLCVPNLENQGFWALDVFLFDLLVLSHLFWSGDADT